MMKRSSSNFRIGDPVIADPQSALGRWRNAVGQALYGGAGHAILAGLLVWNLVVATVLTCSRDNNEEVDDAFDVMNFILLIVFTIHLILQLFYLGPYYSCHHDALFQTVVVVLSWFFAQAQIFRSLSLPYFLDLYYYKTPSSKNLKTLVLFQFDMFIWMYSFALVFTGLFQDLYRQGVTTHDYFGRLDASFYTAFQLFTLDGWSDINRQVMDAYPWAWIVFLPYISGCWFKVFVTSFHVIAANNTSSRTEDTTNSNNNKEEEQDAATIEEDLFGAAAGTIKETAKVVPNYCNDEVLRQILENQKVMQETIARLLQEAEQRKNDYNNA